MLVSNYAENRQIYEKRIFCITRMFHSSKTLFEIFFAPINIFWVMRANYGRHACINAFKSSDNCP